MSDDSVKITGMTEATQWTLDELVQLADQALSVDYEGPPSARVRDRPDRRLVRWYVTRGLVDRPAANGRSARYGRRHLLQLVAIKRMQAQGHSLAEIQAALTGSTDSALERIAKLDLTKLDTVRPSIQVEVDIAGTRAVPHQERARFWVNRPAQSAPPVVPPSTVDRPLPPAETTWPLRAIELSPGITLLVDPARTADADPDAVRFAAQPLLELLVPATPDERSSS